ncbi:MAG TPA: HDIG domain-containing protein [Blastocatellia bacterium]|nr:HDIG domain-containing protein [Blastocatellia bacterium]
MPKPAATSRSQRFARVISGVKAFSASLSDQAVIDAGVGLVVIVVLSILLLRDYQRPQIQPLQADEVATADVIAPEDLQIEDTEETENRRNQAAAKVLPVFDYSHKDTKDRRNRIEQMFATGRSAPADTPTDALRESIEKQSGVVLRNEQVELLRRKGFDPELERLMVDHLEMVLTAGVVNSRSELTRLGVAGIIRHDLKTGQEVPVTDLSSIRDLITASALLRSDKLTWPAEYDREERRLLGEILGSLALANLSYNKTATEARKKEARDSVAPVSVSVERGKPIVVKGETVTPIKAALLEAAAKNRPTGQRAIEFAGTMVIVMLLLLVLWQYMQRYQRRHLRVRRHFLLQVASLVITLGLARLFFALAYAMGEWMKRVPFDSQMSYKYLAPLAVGAALVTILTDAHAAFVFSAILTLCVGVLSGNVHLAAYTLLSSAGAIYHLQNCRDRTALVRAGLWIGLVNAAAALALDLLGANEQLRDSGYLGQLYYALYDAFCGFMSGVLATMVASILLPLFEWLFEITTNIKLLELSNLNLPLLKQLAERAPGTYHHSIMVGLLAEAGAEAIGADALFARVACYYHDIGKMVRPTYFIENQSAVNRHDNLNPKMSSIVLANHVKQGIELARQYKLPPRIIAIIPQHHGTGLMKYFYYKARKQANDSTSNALEQEFRYPGPKPQTKEAAIIMIADSVEAAARTVEEPTPTKLRNMIDTIITRIRDDGQLDECDITLRELRIVAETFVKVVMGIHHHRIAYPGYDFNRVGAQPAPPAATPEAANVPAVAVSEKAPPAPEVRKAIGD